MSRKATPASWGESVIGSLILCATEYSIGSESQEAGRRGRRPLGSVGEAARGREGVEAGFAQHMRGEMARSEHGREGAVADIEPAGVGAERRHHQRLAVAGKTASANRAAALHDA